jgi:predicted enzyme related to lactoylglutathione lyase
LAENSLNRASASVIVDCAYRHIDDRHYSNGRKTMQKFAHNFVWYELVTTDAEAAKAFYRHVIGWNIHDSGMTDRSYAILSAGTRGVGGLMALPDEALAQGAKPGWLGYIWVDAAEDVDTYTAKTLEAGGRLHRAAEDIPGVGRFALVADPQGAPFVLFNGDPPEETPPPVPFGTPGHVGWNELLTSDWEAGFAFYSKLFGWTKTMTVDMGPMGTYQTFATEKDMVGGMMTIAGQSSGWLYYFIVDAIDAGAARVKEKGGELIGEIHRVPGDSWIVRCRDPQGAYFALTAGKR